MTQTAINYGTVLYETGVAKADVDASRELLENNGVLLKSLESPIVSMGEKAAVIDKIFPASMHKFLKVVSEYQNMTLLMDIFNAYEVYSHVQEGVLDAKIYCVDAPVEEQLDNIKKMLCKRFGVKDVLFEIIKKDELLGGFVLRVGDLEIDYSMEGRLKVLREKLIRR